MKPCLQFAACTRVTFETLWWCRSSTCLGSEARFRLRSLIGPVCIGAYQPIHSEPMSDQRHCHESLEMPSQAESACAGESTDTSELPQAPAGEFQSRPNGPPGESADVRRVIPDSARDRAGHGCDEWCIDPHRSAEFAKRHDRIGDMLEDILGEARIERAIPEGKPLSVCDDKYARSVTAHHRVVNVYHDEPVPRGARGARTEIQKAAGRQLLHEDGQEPRALAFASGRDSFHEMHPITVVRGE